MDSVVIFIVWDRNHNAYVLNFFYLFKARMTHIKRGTKSTQFQNLFFLVNFFCKTLYD